MSVEKRIEYLMGAALRAEQEGDPRTARALRLMAEGARELEARKLERQAERTAQASVPRIQPTLACCPE
jgi:hypothetical protein